MSPAQAWEPAVVAVRCDPLAAGLNRYRRQIGVGDEVTLGARLSAEADKNVPMPFPGGYPDIVWLCAKLGNSVQSLLEWRGSLEDFGKRHNSYEPRKDEIGHPERSVRCHASVQPPTHGRVLRKFTEDPFAIKYGLLSLGCPDSDPFPHDKLEDVMKKM